MNTHTMIHVQAHKLLFKHCCPSMYKQAICVTSTIRVHAQTRLSALHGYCELVYYMPCSLVPLHATATVESSTRMRVNFVRQDMCVNVIEMGFACNSYNQVANTHEGEACAAGHVFMFRKNGFLWLA